MVRCSGRVVGMPEHHSHADADSNGGSDRYARTGAHSDADDRRTDEAAQGDRNCTADPNANAHSDTATTSV